MENTVIEEVHMAQIVAGDTIMCGDEKMRTVCKNDIKYGGFCGITIFGSSYISGYQKVKRVRFIVPTNLGIRIA